MARTGRFGRLPTEAPDLSSQIVSMIEQWQNARDNNILEAWQNGGKFEGKKVTDKALLKHYRSRRGEYSKDDPEWDEWNNEVFQIRYRVANERVMMKYQNGQVGPGAVAAHYREWAKKMPKNSSYYRSLMASAGQFAQSASAGRAAAGKAYDYEALMRRVNSHNGAIEAAANTFEVLNNYARSKGFIEGNETIYTANTFEMADIASLMDGVDRSGDADWKRFSAAQKKLWPDWNGRLSWQHLSRMTDQAIAAKKAQIAEYKKAPSDYSSVITGLRKDIAGLRDVKRIRVRVNAMDDYVEAHQEWLEVRGEGKDPDSFLSGDDTYVKDLKAVRQDLLDAGMMAEAGDVWMEIQAVKGNVEAVNGTNNEALWQNSGDTTAGGPTTQYSDLEALANGQDTMISGQELLRQGKAYIVQIAPPTSEVAQSLGVEKQQTFSTREFEIDPTTGKPVMPDASYMSIARKDSSGAVITEMIIGQEIIDEDGNTIGYKAPVDGFHIFKLQDPADPLNWFFTTHDIFTLENGARLDVNGEGKLVLKKDPAAQERLTDRRTELTGSNPKAVLDRLYGAMPDAPPPGSSPSAVKAWEDEVKERQAQEETLSDIEELGLDKADLPESAAGFTQEGDAQHIDQMIDELKRVFPVKPTTGGSKIDSPEAQTAFIRDYLRRTWDEGIDGPIPENLQYNDQDATYVHPDGRPTDRETWGEERLRINEAGEDIYNGEGKPFTRGGQEPIAEAPTGAATSGTGGLESTPLGQMMAGGGPTEPLEGTTTPVGPTEVVPEEAEAQEYDLFPNAFDASGDLVGGVEGAWAMLSDNDYMAFSSPTTAHLNESNWAGFGQNEITQVMQIASFDSSANEVTMQETGIEIDAGIQLQHESAAQKAIIQANMTGDLDAGMAGAALGANRATWEEERKGSAYGDYLGATGTAMGPPAPGAFGTTGYNFEQDTFIDQNQGIGKGIQLGSDFFTNEATAGGTMPKAAASPQVNPKVPDVTVPKVVAQPNVKAPFIPGIQQVRSAPGYVPPAMSMPPPAASIPNVKTPPIPHMAPGGAGGVEGPVEAKYIPPKTFSITKPWEG